MYVETEAQAASTSTHVTAEESKVSALSEMQDALLPMQPATNWALPHGLPELSIHCTLAGPHLLLHLTVSCLDSSPASLEKQRN